jgi:DNA-directed RNA polymerase subunit H (RpoH/RPB5)
MEERALTTLAEMLTARGFKADKFDPIGSSIDETKLYTYGGMLIVFSTKSRVTEKDLTTFIEFSKENNYGNGIIVVSMSRPSDTVLTGLRNYISNTEVPLVQIFELRHLQFNISKHVKVPKHRLVSQDELPDILKANNVDKPNLFRKIDSQDAMAKWIGARPGNVIEVTGMCETSAENKRYLFCMADVTNG